MDVNYKALMFVISIANIICVTKTAPSFRNLPYVFSVAEELVNGTLIGIITATSKTASRVFYELDTAAVGHVVVDKLTGNLTVDGRLDYETKQSLSIKAFAYDEGDPSSKAQASVEIILTNINDNPPKFTNLPKTVQIREDAKIATYVFTSSAKDPDQNDLIYQIVGGSKDLPFEIRDVYKGNIYTKLTLDYEKTQNYTLNISVTDGKPWESSYHIVFGILIIQLIDSDDQGAQFDKTTYKTRIMEGSHHMTWLLQVFARDRDTINHPVTYSIDVATNHGGLFIVNSTSGEIHLNGTVDRETLTSSSKIIFRVLASTTVHSPAIATVEVIVDDVNDNKPIFAKNVYRGMVAENSLKGTPVISVKATDFDQGNNSKLEYKTVGSAGKFSINENGMILVNGSLDRETKDSYNFTVEAFELLTTEKYKSTTRVEIIIVDVNDNSPKFNQTLLEVMVAENVKEQFVTQVQAMDADSGSNSEIRYSIVPDADGKHLKFQIDPTNGTVRTTQALDRETASQYSLLIKAEDKAPIGQRRESVITVKILVQDENDNPPKFDKTSDLVQVTEAANLNTIIKTLKASDPDTGINAKLRYSIIHGNTNEAFGIEKESGTLKTVKALDRETQSNYNLTIQVTDGGNLSSICSLVVKVLDINDNSPKFDVNDFYAFNVTEESMNAFVGIVKAQDKDEGNSGTVVYRITNSDRFAINKTTGVITTEGKLDREERTEYGITVVATDQSEIGPRSTYVQVKITVLDINDNNPQFQSPKLYSSVIRRDSLPGTIIHQFRATDADQGKNGDLKYKTSLQLPDFLTLNESIGLLSLAKPIPSHTNRTMDIAVLVMDNGIPVRKDTASLRVFFSNIVIDAPALESRSLQVTIMENLPADSTVTDLNATYKGNIVTNGLDFTIMHGSKGKFHIEKSSGIIKTAVILDREQESEFALVIMVKFKDQDKINFGTVDIRVLDANDHPPVFNKIHETVTLMENHNASQPIFTASATDVDEGPNKLIRFSISGEDKLSYRINPISGQLFSLVPFDREAKDNMNVTLFASNDAVLPQLITNMSLTILVTDFNDNAPTFVKDVYYFSVKENITVNSNVGLVSATDADNGINANIKYSVDYTRSTVGSDCFTIEFNTGNIKVSCSLDSEKIAEYNMTVVATDEGDPSLSSRVSVFISVEDVNDNYPKFTQREYRVTPLEDAKPGVVIATFEAVDADTTKDAVAFSIFSGNSKGFFGMNSTSGQLILNKALDRETIASFKLTIRAKPIYINTGNQSRRKRRSTGNIAIFDEAVVDIIVKDVNDNPPSFPKSLYITAVREDSPFNTLVTTVKGNDLDEGNYSGLAYSVIKEATPMKFVIEMYSGKVFVRKSLVGDAGKTFTFVVTAKDNFGHAPFNAASNNATIHLHVINDNHIGRIIAGVDAVLLHKNLNVLKTLLESAVGGSVTIQRIEPTTSQDSSIIVIHAVDEKRHHILTREEIQSGVLNPPNNTIKEALKKWNITVIVLRTTTSPVQKDKNSDYVILAIIGGSLLVLTLAGIFIWILLRRRKRRKEKAEEELRNGKLTIGTVNPMVYNNNKSVRYYIEPYESPENHVEEHEEAKEEEQEEDSKGLSNPFYTVEEAEPSELAQTSYLSYGTLTSQARTHWAYGDDDTQDLEDEIDEIMAEKIANKAEMVTAL